MNRDQKLWNRMSNYYDAFMKKDAELYSRITTGIKDLSTPRMRVLEIGTATGIISFLLADYFESITAIDFSDKMIQKAIQKAVDGGVNNIDFKHDDACSLRFEDNTFDRVVMANVLHIMPNPERALMEIKRVLTPDGILIAPTFVHADHPKAKLFAFFALFCGFKAYSKWSIETYKAFLMENQYEILEAFSVKASFPVAFVVCKPQ